MLRQRRGGDRLHPAQDGERLREERRLLRDDRGRLQAPDLHHVVAERIDDAVERLVRHALPLVAAARQDDGVGGLEEESARELANEGALADPRLPLDEDGDARPLAHVGERALQGRELPFAPDERRDLSLRGGRRYVPRRAARVERFFHVEPAEHLARARPRARIEAEQLDAQGVEIARHGGDERAWRRRLEPLLVHQDLERRPVEREPPGERFVENDADRVPVRRGPERLRSGLLGRHVGARPDDLVGARARVVLFEVRDEPEVEQDDAAGARDEDVRRLDVAVELSGHVQRREPARELAERAPELRLVVARSTHVAATQTGCGGGSVCAGVGVARMRERPGGDEVRRHPVGRLERRFAPGVTGRDVAEKIGPFHELHREKPAPLVLEERIEADEVRVLHVLQGAKFVFEPEDPLRVQVPERLQRDARGPFSVERLVDDPHAAGAEPTQHLESLRAAEVDLGRIQGFSASVAGSGGRERGPGNGGDRTGATSGP